MQSEKNKAVVRRFNKECIEQGIPASFEELLAEEVINHAAPPGSPNGRASFYYFLNDVLRKGFPDLRVEILSQIAEGEQVATRKRISATHTGAILGIAPTQKKVQIDVIDIIRLENGRYAEHWGQSNFAEVIKGLAGK
ncbi:MAG: ester cyclase [Bacteroidota bacterium]|nr:ester cyclase [Bacteroidota bacterium]MDP4245347.1 ester cyclase [Bacteroidota bacterium]MDP4252624.1 ester cyclase [Bacteroidota bacterium]MDP4258489.1 ester cyclase [Bacteroidota bacterium]